jgi:SAM-dependent methyltransferase
MFAPEAETAVAGAGWCEERGLHAILAAARTFDPERVTAGVIERLAPGAQDAVLELGCGSGRALLQVASRVSRGVVVGVEPSELLLRHAGRRTRQLVERGRVRLHRGTSSDLGGFADGAFDKAFGVHVVPLWCDPRADLREIRRVLRPGGRLVLAFRPPDDAGASARRGASFAPARLDTMLRDAGFADVETAVIREAGPRLAWTSARR